MMHHKLTAFTLMETIVALLLTSILIGFAYSSLRLVRFQAGKLMGNTGAVNEAIRFDRSLQADTRHSQTILIHEDGLTFIVNERRVQYLIADSVWLRIAPTEPADTFHVRVDSLRGWLNGIHQLEDGHLVDDVVIYAGRNGVQGQFQVTKYYDAAQLIQLTDTADGRY